MTPRSRLARIVVAVVASSASAACSGDATAPAARSADPARPSASAAASTPAPGARATVTPGAPAAAPGAPAAPPFEGTAGIEERKRDGMKPAVLAAVRVAAHDGYERVVFEMTGKELPGWHVEYVDRPVRRCGSGDATAIAGDGWLEVRMTPAQAHDERGRATVAERERHPGLPVIREIEATCDFEGEVTWVIGVSSPNRYRVLELSDPPRLVVDVRADPRPVKP